MPAMPACMNWCGELRGWRCTDGLSVPALLGLAGAYQFSALKYQCLDKCRSPLMFVSEQWHGAHARRDSFLLGVRHGLFCVGCCWTLMCLMFAIGTGNIGWMLALAAVMSAEKNLPWGGGLSGPIGVALLGVGGGPSRSTGFDSPDRCDGEYAIHVARYHGFAWTRFFGITKDNLDYRHHE